MNEKGQLSADFLFATFILLIVISSIVEIVSIGIDTANDAQLAEARTIGEKVAGAINTVYTSGDGHFVSVNLSRNVNFTLMVNNATINPTNATVAVQLGGRTTISNLIPNRGNVTSTTMRPNGIYRISNRNGSVNITKLS